MTDRTYVIREGRVFAYGDRESIINNADVRRYYIGERFDVGHLLDKRHRHAITGETQPSAAEPDFGTITTDVVLNHVDDDTLRPDRGDDSYLD